MNTPFIQFMQIRKYRSRILRPKHNDLATRERNIHLLTVERIVPNTIPFCQAVEEPLGIKGRNIGGATGGNDDGGDGLYLLTEICSYLYLTSSHHASNS